MQRGEVSVQDRKHLEEVLRLIEARKDSYGWVWLRTLLSRFEHDQEWRHTTTRIDFLPAQVSKPEQLKWEYEQTLLVKAALTLKESVTLLVKTVDQGELAVPDCVLSGLEGSLSSRYRCASKNPISRLPWAADLFQFRVNNYGQLVGGHLVSSDHPVFSDPSALLREHMDSDSQRSIGSIDIFLPNYAVRIESLKLQHGRIDLAVHRDSLLATDLVVQIHATEAWGNGVLHDRFTMSGSTCTMPVTFTVGEMYLVILAPGSREVIDYRHFRRSITDGFDAADVELAMDADEEIEALILQGETAGTEFKFKLPDGIDLAESAVAFANTTGGRILIGVNDHGEVVGCDPQKIEETIRDVLAHYCEPPIRPKVTAVQISGKQIIVVSVSGGSNKPYTLRGKGVIVRAGSTDRAATRHDLDEFYSGKNAAGAEWIPR
jgi:hypothetical protein